MLFGSLQMFVLIGYLLAVWNTALRKSVVKRALLCQWQFHETFIHLKLIEVTKENFRSVSIALPLPKIWLSMGFVHSYEKSSTLEI